MVEKLETWPKKGRDKNFLPILDRHDDRLLTGYKSLQSNRVSLSWTLQMSESSTAPVKFLLRRDSLVHKISAHIWKHATASGWGPMGPWVRFHWWRWPLTSVDKYGPFGDERRSYREGWRGSPLLCCWSNSLALPYESSTSQSPRVTSPRVTSVRLNSWAVDKCSWEEVSSKVWGPGLNSKAGCR